MDFELVDVEPPRPRDNGVVSVDGILLRGRELAAAAAEVGVLRKRKDLQRNVASFIVVDRKTIFVFLPKAERGLLKKVLFCRNTETTERSCFCRNTVFRQKQPLSAGKSCYFILISTKFRLNIVLIFV